MIYIICITYNFIINNNFIQSLILTQTLKRGRFLLDTTTTVFVLYQYTALSLLVSIWWSLCCYHRDVLQENPESSARSFPEPDCEAQFLLPIPPSLQYKPMTFQSEITLT